MQIDYTIQTINEAAQDIWNRYSNKKIWAFDAPMGAGKTTFIKTLCEDILGCEDVISSPTFSIINEYKSKIVSTVYHMDWYRLKDEEEAVNAGIEDVLYSGNLCFVEWPERAPMLLPQEALNIRIEILGITERRILIK